MSRFVGVVLVFCSLVCNSGDSLLLLVLVAVRCSCLF